MNDKTLKLLTDAALALSVIVTIPAMLVAAGWKTSIGLVLFILWAVSPYIGIFAISLSAKKLPQFPKLPLVFCVVSVLMLGFTLLAYVGTLGDRSSTYGLIFIFVPLYLYVGSFILLGCGLMWAMLSKPAANKSRRD